MKELNLDMINFDIAYVQINGSVVTVDPNPFCFSDKYETLKIKIFPSMIQINGDKVNSKWLELKSKNRNDFVDIEDRFIKEKMVRTHWFSMKKNLIYYVDGIVQYKKTIPTKITLSNMHLVVFEKT